LKYSESKKVGNRVFRVERQDQTNVCLVLLLVWRIVTLILQLILERCHSCFVKKFYKSQVSLHSVSLY